VVKIYSDVSRAFSRSSKVTPSAREPSDLTCYAGHCPGWEAGRPQLIGSGALFPAGTVWDVVLELYVNKLKRLSRG
jgi:hypothetical protein